MNILTRIVDERRADVEKLRDGTPVEALREQAVGRAHHSLVERLAAEPGTSVISEIKKASPSAGLLRPDYQPGEIARGYEEAGAIGISVLTEPRHFQGNDEHLRAVRSTVQLPILRKDFMCDPYQVVEAAAWGADVILIIIAALEPSEVQGLYDEAMRLNLDVLAEAHTEEEVKVALTLDQAIVGVNSRNLKTLETDLAVARELSDFIPADRVSVAESGIRTREDIEELELLGYNGFLVGEALMREGDPSDKLRELIGG